MPKVKAKCPYCGEEFIRIDEEEHITWERGEAFGLNKNRYFHLTCAEKAKIAPKNEWPEYLIKVQKAGGELAMWADMCYDFLRKDLKIGADYQKIKSQLENFNKKRTMKYEGMYKTLRYCYEIKHLDYDKAEGGIGIIPYMYEDAANYFVSQINKQNKFVEELNKQIEERKNAATVQVAKRKASGKIKKIDLSELDGKE